MTDLFQEDNKDYVAELVGEGKKFKSIQDLAKGKIEADSYIESLVRQKDELRDDYLKLRENSQARASLEEMLDKMQASKTQQSSEQPLAKESENRPSFDPSALEEIVEKKIREREASSQKKLNAQTVLDALKAKYGHSYQDVLNKQTEELGLTKETAQYLAETSPRALMKQLGLDQQQVRDPFQTPPRNSSYLAPRGEQKRTWSFYDKMKKDDPETYWKPSTQAQMHKDYRALGSEFEDGGLDSVFE